MLRNGQGRAVRYAWGRPLGSASILIGVFVLVVLPLAQSASANHIASATYTGTTSSGGTVRLVVNAAGTNVTINVSGVRGAAPAGCPPAADPLTGTVASTAINTAAGDHIFDAVITGTNLSGDSRINGLFQSAGQARGTLRMNRIAPGDPCDTGDVAWTAQTDARTRTPRPTRTPRRLRGREAACLDFKTQLEAQSFFTAHLPGDPFGLDPNGNGIACEALPALLATATPTATRRGAGLPVTGSHTPLYGFTGLGFVCLGIALIAFTNRTRDAAVAPELVLPTTLPLTGHRDVAPYEGDFVMSGWMPQSRR